MIDFLTWMKSQGLSESSITKYATALKGVLSKWSNDAKITQKSILEIRNINEFLMVQSRLRDVDIFKQRDAVGNQMYSAALKNYLLFLNAQDESNLGKDIEGIISQGETDPTEKISMIKARIGQGTFRSDLIELWRGCSVTKCKNISMLQASHIKPWAKSNNFERLDKYNGFLLLPNLDRAFDSGFITFEDDGNIIISDHFEGFDMFGISSNMSVSLQKEHLKYLSYHRNHIFRN